MTLIWKRDVTVSEGIDGINWTITGYRWKFSNHFSLIEKWELDEVPFLNHFPNECKHFDKLIHSEPFQLIGISVKDDEKSSVNYEEDSYVEKSFVNC